MNLTWDIGEVLVSHYKAESLIINDAISCQIIDKTWAALNVWGHSNQPFDVAKIALGTHG
jgi:hypothetical protein